MIRGYTRVSTEDQAREGRSSIEDQERRIRAIAAIRDEPTDPEMWSDPGVSGAIPLVQRPAGARLVEALTRGDVVVAAKLDRLFRNAEDALAQSREWREAGIDLILVDMGTEPVTTSAAGRLYFGMLAQFAEFERERIAERIRDGRASKRARGGFTGGHPPFGYAVSGVGRTAVLVENEAEAALIERARYYANAHLPRSPTRVAEMLNADGLTSRAGTPIVAAQVWRWLQQNN